MILKVLCLMFWKVFVSFGLLFVVWRIFNWWFLFLIIGVVCMSMKLVILVCMRFLLFWKVRLYWLFNNFMVVVKWF